MLIGKGGFYGNVFRITPPLCFTKEDAGWFSSHSCSSSTSSSSSSSSSSSANSSNCISPLVVDFLVDVMDYTMSKM